MKNNQPAMPPWEPGMTVRMGATYRERATGILMTIVSVSCPDNHLLLSPPVKKWEGTSQEFAEAFELVAPYMPSQESAELDGAMDELERAIPNWMPPNPAPNAQIHERLGELTEELVRHHRAGEWNMYRLALKETNRLLDEMTISE